MAVRWFSPGRLVRPILARRLRRRAGCGRQQASMVGFCLWRVACQPGREAAKTGGAEGGRTPDLLIANEALSQLSYGPRSRETGATMLTGSLAVKHGLRRDPGSGRPC